MPFIMKRIVDICWVVIRYVQEILQEKQTLLEGFIVTLMPLWLPFGIPSLDQACQIDRLVCFIALGWKSFLAFM